MTDLEDRDLDTQQAPTGGGPEGAPRRRRRSGSRVLPVVAIALVVTVILVVLWFLFFRQPGVEEPAAEVPAPTLPEVEPSAEPAEPEVEEELPELSASDELVRTLVGELSSHPRLASLLASEQLVRRFVAVVDNVARGTSPSSHVPDAVPEEPFPVVTEDDGTLRLDPAGYRRYDTLVAVITGLEPEGAAELYRRLEPLVDQAYRELGYPEADFDRTLARAMAELLAVPVVDGEPELVPVKTTYEYADPRLEDLSAAQKHLLRTGPDNVRRVQAHLRALARELGLAERVERYRRQA